MKNINNILQKNMIFFIEIFVYAMLILLNVFFAFEIYDKVIEKVSPSSKAAEIEVTKLNSLNSDLLTVFEDDHKERKSYVDEGNSSFDNRWDSLESPKSPF